MGKNWHTKGKKLNFSWNIGVKFPLWFRLGNIYKSNGKWTQLKSSQRIEEAFYITCNKLMKKINGKEHDDFFFFYNKQVTLIDDR